MNRTRGDRAPTTRGGNQSKVGPSVNERLVALEQGLSDARHWNSVMNAQLEAALHTIKMVGHDLQLRESFNRVLRRRDLIFEMRSNRQLTFQEAADQVTFWNADDMNPQITAQSLGGLLLVLARDDNRTPPQERANVLLGFGYGESDISSVIPQFESKHLAQSESAS